MMSIAAFVNVVLALMFVVVDVCVVARPCQPSSAMLVVVSIQEIAPLACVVVAMIQGVLLRFSCVLTAGVNVPIIVFVVDMVVVVPIFSVAVTTCWSIELL